jgi:hypothetical protein
MSLIAEIDIKPLIRQETSAAEGVAGNPRAATVRDAVSGFV